MHHSSIPWTSAAPPRKILVMRFQAQGDVVITLPYLQDLKDRTPGMAIHFLTRREVGEIPSRLDLFSRVFRIGGGRNARLQFILCMLLMPYLWWQRYDVVVDLQNHRISKIIRKLLNARAWSEFDRSSPSAAGERTRTTIEAAGLGPVGIAARIAYDPLAAIGRVLKDAGIAAGIKYIILNPAGAFASRNWPLENYVMFVRRWLESDPHVRFVILGLSTMQQKATYLKNQIGTPLVDLTGKTSPWQAYAVVGNATLVISEDSGLMHMAWTQHVPTVALLGSTRNDWSAPLGSWTHCFNSSDLPCGNCEQAACKFGDNRCLTRVAVGEVAERAIELLRTHQETAIVKSPQQTTGQTPDLNVMIR